MQENRRGFFRGLPLAIAGLFAAGTAKAATRVHVAQLRGTPNTLAGFDPFGIGQSITIGAGLSLNGSTLSTNASIGSRLKSRRWARS